VVSTSFDAKITGRAGGKTTFTGFYRFNDRDNQTPVHIFQFADAEEPISPNTNFSASNPLGALLANNANANRPYSRKTNLATLEADYKLAADQSVKGGYAYERNHRWCGGSWIDCADTSITNEHTLKAEWRADFGSRVNARVSYGYGMRRTPSYNENAFLALVPYAGVSPTAATGGATALSFMTDNGWNGWGPALGYAATTGNMNLFFPSNNALANALYVNANRISELQGMRRYYVADRNRNRLRSGLNWQATDAFSLQGGVDFTLDDYTDAKYGLQSSDLWSTSIDGTYAVAEGLTAAAYYNYQHQRGITAGNTYTANSNTSSVNGFTALSGNGCDGYTTLLQRNNNNKLDPCLDWTANMLDQAHTFGFTLAKTADRGDLTADAIYSRAETTNDVTGGSWVNNLLALPGAPAGTIAAYFIPATALPAVTARSIEFRLNARIKVDARQSVRFIYSYLRLSNVDWQYDGMQIGAATLSGVLPTNETAFNDSAHIFAASYVIRF
jgi:hypothetical protein